MKNYFILTLFLFITATVSGQHENHEYDSTLAAKLGADDLGMKSYVLVILKTGPSDIQDRELRDSLFAGHFSNMSRLASEKKLIVSGPFYSNESQYRGLFLFDVATIEEATELVKSDPTVATGIFETEMYRWYGSAAIPLLLDLYPKLQKSRAQ